MAETNQTTELTQLPVKKSRFKNFISNHPRTAWVVGVLAALLALVGVTAAVKSKKEDNSTSADGTEVQALEPTTETA